VAVTRTHQCPTVGQLLPAITRYGRRTNRVAASFIHPPLMFLLALGMVFAHVCTVGGYAMGAGDSRSWLHAFSLVAVFAVTST